MEFKNATGAKVCGDARHNRRRVTEAEHKGAAVGVVEGPSSPFFFCVVDVEVVVGRDAEWNCFAARNQ